MAGQDLQQLRHRLTRAGYLGIGLAVLELAIAAIYGIGGLWVVGGVFLAISAVCFAMSWSLRNQQG